MMLLDSLTPTAQHDATNYARSADPAEQRLHALVYRTKEITCLKSIVIDGGCVSSEKSSRVGRAFDLIENPTDCEAIYD